MYSNYFEPGKRCDDDRSIDRLSSTQRMPPPVNQRIQDGGQRPPVLNGSRLSIMLRQHPRWWVQNGGRRKEKKRIDSIKSWTWNLLIRSQAPYPFGHRVIVMLRRRHSEVLILEPSVYETDVIFTSLPCHNIKKKIKTFTWKRNERIWTS